jgi:melibiose permease/lactose/raffinose/galactose permease
VTETLDGEAGAVRPAAARRDPAHRRNQWLFGIGTTGRDMVYTLIAFWLIYYLTEVLTLDNATLGALTALILGIRLLDAVLDPIAGSIVDGTRSRWGQFKPWLLASSFVAAFFTILLFTDTQLTGWQFVTVFCLVNLLWGVGWAVNDISYWGMLPALSLDKRDREQTGSIAKVFSTVGLFVVAAGALPFVNALQDNGIAETTSWMWLAVACSTLMVLSILVTVLGVRERRDIDTSGERVSIGEIWRVLAGNDQLVWAAVAYGLFMFGNGLVGTFGPYFFKYVYGDEKVFDTFVIFVGLGQLAGYAVFPLLSARMPRARLYAFVTALMVLGLVGFFFLPMNILLLGAAAVFLFFLASVVMLLMLVFQADTIEYGQLKLGQRNGAVTFALQPFINKVSGALNTAVVGLVAILSGINDAASPADVSDGGRLLVRATMLLVPAVLVAVAYLVWRRKFVIDEAAHARIVAELDVRGALRADVSAS